MKTIVIHPDDRSTDFLSNIYKNKDWTILTSWSKTKEELRDYLSSFDRVIMMGHGTPDGLINTGSFYTQPAENIDSWIDNKICAALNNFYVIDDSFADVLRTKETISVWCHSDHYFRRNNIPGFHTGMIISEVSEASFVLGTAPLSAEETLENMNAFADIIHDCIDEDPENMKKYILEKYNFSDKVTQYNRQNIIVL